jgi:hypothetical protein
VKLKPIPLSMLLCIITFAYSLVACEKNERAQITEHQEVKAISQPIDLNSLCHNLTKEMQSIDNTRTTFALEQINQNLKICLPLMSFKDQKHLINLSTQMYQNFFKVERTAQQQNAFNLHALDMAQHPTIQQSHYQEFSARDQYLLRHKGQAYVEVYDAGDAGLIYRRNPQYLARIFAPYLPKAEKVFIEHLAQQNMQPVVRNHKINVDAKVLAERALFWEHYIEQYPRSTYLKEAHQLFNLYSSLLFLGTRVAPISTTFANEQSIQSDHFSAIENIAQLSNSKLATKARKFINFIHMNTNEKTQMNSGQSSRENLKKHLQIEDVSKSDLSRCLTDAIYQ